MMHKLRAAAAASVLLIAISGSGPVAAQKQGGILRMYLPDSPPSLSVLEQSDYVQAMMGMFNNLVLFDQNVKQNGLQSIVPDLATGWSWNEDGKELSFPLRQGVKWHDGKPFTAADVKCTWELLIEIGNEKLRLNPRKSWYSNLERVTTNGDYEVTFHLKRPQPALLSLLASGWSPVYPCHLSPAEMRRHPIGTGPFKFAEFKPNERITLTRNSDYWKKGGLTSMASSLRSFATRRRRTSHSSPGSWIGLQSRSRPSRTSRAKRLMRFARCSLPVVVAI